MLSLIVFFGGNNGNNLKFLAFNRKNAPKSIYKYSQIACNHKALFTLKSTFSLSELSSESAPLLQVRRICLIYC